MTILSRILKLYAPEKGWLLLGVLLGTVTACASIALMSLSGWFIAAMGVAGVTGAAINYFTPAAAIRTLAMVRTAGRYGERMLTHKAALQVTARTRSWLYDHIEKLPASRLMQLHSGDLFGRLRSDIETLEKFYLGVIVPYAVAILSLLPIMLYLAVQQPVLALMTTCLLLTSGILAPLWVARVSRPMQRDIAATTTQLRVALGESWQAAGEIMVYGQGERCASSLNALSRRITAAQNDQHIAALVGQGVSTFLANLSGLAAILVLAPQAIDHQISRPDIAMLSLLCMACFDVIMPLAPALQVWQGVCLAARRIFALVDNLPSAGKILVPDIPFCLTVDRLTFAYDDGREILQEAGFSIAAGETLAVTGPSGAGKSTLVSLLAGLYKPTGGTISMNGVSSCLAQGDSWRRQLSVAEQRPHVFAGTLRRNLLLAAPAATDEDMHKACALAGLADDVDRMPAGIDTFLGELGVGLSGGQLRRLALARALLKPAGCLVLDEPTDGLDVDMGRAVVSSILAYARGRNMAVIIVTHDSFIADMCEKKHHIPVHDAA